MSREKRESQKCSISRRQFLKGTAALTAGTIISGCGSDHDAQEEPPGSRSSVGGMDLRGKDARARLIGPAEVAADSCHTWEIQYTAGQGGVSLGGQVAIGVEHGADWGRANFFGRDKFGGFSVRTDSNAILTIDKYTYASGNALVAKVRKGFIAEGQTVTITIGDPQTGETMKAPSIAHEATIKVFHCLDNAVNEQGYTKFEPIETLVVNVFPLETVALSAFAKSTALVGRDVVLVVRAEDQFGNITPEYRATLEFFDDETNAHLATVQMTEADEGCAYAAGIRLDRTGVVRLRIEDKDNGFVCYSDPVEVTNNPSHQGVIWGQMHGHSIVSDGLGTAVEYYDYARHQGNLDFCALTDHGYLTEPFVNRAFFRHYIDEETWNEYAAVAREKNEPGAFVTLLAYEWTSHIFNDKNVYFLDDDVPWEEYPKTRDALYARYHGRRVMIISHMMWAVPFMRAIDWNHLDPSLERVVEIASVHGAREYPYNPYFPDDTWMAKMGFLMGGHLVTDALQTGRKLGIICGADTHTGCPGNSISGIHSCRVNGLMALRSATLTRESIWDAWFNRRCYGTSGPRMIVDVSFQGHPMGSEVTRAGIGPRPFVVTAYGKGGIEKIELVCGDPEAPVDVIAFDPPIWKVGSVELMDEAPVRGESCYYIRVYQEDGHLAWTSPIWVSS